jgi:hypothetical protein
MARQYYTLCIKEFGKWEPQFGDYSKSVVEQEARDVYADRYSMDYVPAKNRKIITTSDKQSDIVHAIAKLNGE